MPENEAPVPIEAQRFLFRLQAFLPAIGQAALNETLKVEVNSDTEATITLPTVGIGIDVGHPVPVRFAADSGLTRDGLRVFTLETVRGGRWHPDETVDATQCETEDCGEALVKLAALLAEMELDGLPEFPEPLRRPEPVVEEAW